MIQNEKPTDPMDQKSGLDVEEPPPYSRRQASTSSNRLRAQTEPRGRFIAPAPITYQPPAHPPIPSPRVIVSHSEQDARAASFTDLAVEKPASPKTGMYPEYSGGNALYPPGAIGADSTFSVPSTTSAEASAFPPRSPTALSNTKNRIDTLIMMGTGTSANWLNHVVVATKGDVKYQCEIDPTLPVQDFATARRTANLGRKQHSRSSSNLSTSSSKSGKKKADYSWHPSAAPEVCNGYFESKSGNVDLVLIIGSAPGSARSPPISGSGKANVDVRSKNGKVSVKVLEILDGRRINLDVLTAKGDVEVFLPRTFSGPLHVHTDGEITLLPRLAASMEVITARDDDALVMVTSFKTSPSPSPSPSASGHHHPYSHQLHHPHRPSSASNWLQPGTAGSPRTPTYEGDYANLVSSLGGNIIVGFMGEDKVKEESPGMWKKFVRLFTGRSNSA